MPIKPENKKLYPKNWKEIREKILKRANNCCEFCGLPNHIEGYRTPNGNFISCEDIQFFGKKKLFKKIKIVLTIAHLDHNPQNNEPSNLRALCQRCHNRYDTQHRKATRQKTKECK